MIIPTSFINSDMEACAKDDGHGNDAVMDSHECWSQAGLRKGSMMLNGRWEMCSSQVAFSPCFLSFARHVPAALVEYPVTFDQAEALIK